jgi:hypothetical protein
MTYRSRYPAKAMKRPANNDDELRLMTREDGMQDLPEAPVAKGYVQSHQLPDSAENAVRDRHLWVITPESLPYALEGCPWGTRLQSGLIKHSNLTGGQSANSGGELWFIDERTMVINANSGRYGAETPEELDEIVDGLLHCGYRVASMGFDIDNPKRPNSVLIGKPEWREPQKPS